MAKSLPVTASVLKAYIRGNYLKKGAVEMARKMKVSLPTIHKYGKLAGVKVSSSLKPIVTKRAEIDKRVEFIRKHGKGMTAKEIGKKLKIAEHNVNWLVKKYGLQVKRRRRPKKYRQVNTVKSRYFNVNARWSWLIG